MLSCIHMESITEINLLVSVGVNVVTELVGKKKNI